jgi:hypothetical protein
MSLINTFLLGSGFPVQDSPVSQGVLSIMVNSGVLSRVRIQESPELLKPFPGMGILQNSKIFAYLSGQLEVYSPGCLRIPPVSNYDSLWAGLPPYYERKAST